MCFNVSSLFEVLNAFRYIEISVWQVSNFFDLIIVSLCCQISFYVRKHIKYTIWKLIQNAFNKLKEKLKKKTKQIIVLFVNKHFVQNNH